MNWQFFCHPEKYISEILTLAKLVIWDPGTVIFSERAQSLLFFIPLGICVYISNDFVFWEYNFLCCFTENSTLNFSPTHILNFKCVPFEISDKTLLGIKEEQGWVVWQLCFELLLQECKGWTHREYLQNGESLNWIGLPLHLALTWQT